MKIIEIKTNKQKRNYLNFLYEIYKDDPKYCDMNVIFVKNFLYKKDGFSKRNKIMPIMIYDENLPKLECIFVIDKTDEIKISFLEFVQHSEKYLNKIMEISCALMGKYNKKKTVIGVNGQISYGLGFLTKDYNQNFEFNSNYNKNYYVDEMDAIFPVIKRAFSYKYNVNNSIKFFNNDIVQNVYDEYQFRLFDKRKFKKEMLLFGKLCHESLKNTPYYSEKTPEEMYELMKKIKLFFKKEDIIFAMKNGKEIGFIYTHPDYAEFFNSGKINYIKTFIKFLYKKPKKIIYNVIGVIPEYQKSGIAMNLIDYTLKIRKTNFKEGSSSFILEDNKESTNLCKKMSTGINKEFHLYEIERKDR